MRIKNQDKNIKRKRNRSKRRERRVRTDVPERVIARKSMITSDL